MLHHDWENYKKYRSTEGLINVMRAPEIAGRTLAIAYNIYERVGLALRDKTEGLFYSHV